MATPGEFGEHESGYEAEAIPAKGSVNARPIVTAGLAKLMLLVNQ